MVMVVLVVATYSCYWVINGLHIEKQTATDLGHTAWTYNMKYWNKK
jgi:hypothetical protein